jgi:hypothetical protein
MRAESCKVCPNARLLAAWRACACAIDRSFVVIDSSILGLTMESNSTGRTANAPQAARDTMAQKWPL